MLTLLYRSRSEPNLPRTSPSAGRGLNYSAHFSMASSFWPSACPSFFSPLRDSYPFSVSSSHSIPVLGEMPIFHLTYHISTAVESPKLVLVIGSVGLALNLLSASLLHEHHGHDHGGHGHGHSHSHIVDNSHEHGHSHSHVNIEAAIPSRQSFSDDILLTVGRIIFHLSHPLLSLFLANQRSRGAPTYHHQAAGPRPRSRDDGCACTRPRRRTEQSCRYHRRPCDLANKLAITLLR